MTVRSLMIHHWLPLVTFCYAHVTPMFPLQMGYAVSPRINQQDLWIDLGIQAGACMTQPENCGSAGGAVSLWINVHAGDQRGRTGRTGVITSMDDITPDIISTGFQIRCGTDGCS